MQIKNSFCKPINNIVFLKTHKTGSSSIQNILMRFGDSNDLTFALPKKANYYRYPEPFNRKLFNLSYLYTMGEFSMRDAIQQFLNKSHIKGSIQALQIEDVWEEIMGKTVARYTDKLQIISDRLIITTKVAPLKHELIYQKEKIKLRVNEALGKNIINEVIVM